MSVVAEVRLNAKAREDSRNSVVQNSSASDNRPSLFKAIKTHSFKLNGIVYEWMDDMYFKKVNVKYQEDCFGEDALLRKTTRNATIMTMDETVHFVTLS